MKKIARNGIVLSASQILARLIGLVYFIFVARKLSVGDFGIYTFTLSFVYIFYPVADFGIERLVLRDISRETEKSNEYLNKLFPLKIILSVLSILLILISGACLKQSSDQLYYFIIFGLAIIPYNLTFLIMAIKNAHEKMQFMAAANISSIIISALIGTVFLITGASLAWVLSAFLFGYIIVFLIFYFNLNRIDLKLKIEIDRIFWKKVIKESWVFATLTIIAVVYLRTSVIVLNLIKGPVDTGIYSSAFKFIEGGILIPQSLSLALFPLSSRLFISDKNNLKKVYLKGLLVLFLCSLPLSLIFIFAPKLLITLSFGSKYLQAAEIFPLLGIALILFFLNSLAGNIIQNSNKVKSFIPYLFLNLIIEVVLCLILIPKYSITGSAWAVVGGEIFGLLINNIFVYKILKSNI